MAERLVPYEMGTTAIAGELTNLLGYRGTFNDFDYDGTGAIQQVSGMTIVAVWVKNGSGAALLPGEIATWGTTSGDAGTIVGAKAAALSVAAGVVDPFLPAAGVAANKHFWLVVQGPTQVIHAGNDTITAGESLVVATNGRVDEFVPTDTAAKDAASCFGWAIDTPANNNAGTKFRALVNFMSA